MSRSSARFAIALMSGITAAAAMSGRAQGADELSELDPAPPVVYEARITALEAVHPDDRIPCRNFNMNAAQVVRYFQLAEEKSGAELHGYMWLPCEARGHLDWEGKRYEFRVNLGRTAVLIGPNGRQRHFGCAHACDGLLLGNRAWDAAGDIDD